MSPLLIDYMRHVRDECDFIIGLAQSMTFDEFVADRRNKLCASKSIEIMGEALKRIPPEVLAKRPNVPWRQIIRMRDRMAHGYFDINYTIVWDVMLNLAPVLRIVVDEMIDSMERNVDSNEE